MVLKILVNVPKVILGFVFACLFIPTLIALVVLIYFLKGLLFLAKLLG